MTGSAKRGPRLARVVILTVFAIAMGCVESVSIYYLRTLHGTVDPAQPIGLIAPEVPSMWWVEVAREIAALVMLGTVSWLAGPELSTRFGAFLLSFAVWDVAYYAFLAWLSGWPKSLLAVDILFQVPLPWWGPVLAPLLIAALMAAAGVELLVRQRPVARVDAATWGLLAVGTCLCLWAFQADAIAALSHGLDAALRAAPGPFSWLSFLAGLGVGTWGTVRDLRR